MLNHALKYLRMGLSVIPLRPKSKEPLIPWKPYQIKKATEGEVREWWRVAPNANIGIVTGEISNLAVVDLDGPEGLSTGSKLGLHSTVTSLTGRGKQLWYRYPKEGIGNSVKIHPGLDIRGEGGYVVAPPSIHPTGLRYRWMNKQPLKLSQEFPSALLVQTVSTQIVNGKEEGWIAKALEGMKDGNIDNTFTSVLGRMRRDGWSAGDALALLRPHAEKVNAEPGHLDEKIENIWARYEPSPRKSLQSSVGYLEEGFAIHSPSDSDSWEQFRNRHAEILNDPSQRLETGYPKLDALLLKGIKSSRLFTIAARTGVGKTNWLIGAIRTLCRASKRVLLFSTEMPYEEIWERYIATLKDSEEFKQHQFYVCDSFSPNLEKIEEAINEIKPDVFVFDHINHVSEEGRELGAFMQGLNLLRRKYDCAGIITAQLNRNADWVDLKTGEKVTPRVSMIKGSGTIEQASSRVLLLSETRVTPEYTEIVGNLDKNDNGAKGLIHFGLFNKPWRMEELP